MTACDLWVDFNDVDRAGNVTTLAGFATVPILPGQQVTVGDVEGNRATATVQRIYLGNYAAELVDVTVDLDTFTAAPPPRPTACSPWCPVDHTAPPSPKTRCWHRRRP